MAKPKLALIPSAQGSKFYSVLPSSGVGDFNFTRSGSATRINSQGLIESVGSGVSRLNYPMIDGVVKGCPHHILEPSRTNYIDKSNTFVDWNLGGVVSRTANYGISPDGTLNSTRADFANGGIIYRSPNRPQGAYVFSVFAKNIEGGGSQIVLRIDIPASKVGIFDLSNGTIVSNTTDDAKIEYYGNGWYRCVIIQNNDSVTNAVIGEGTTELDCELFGAMLEEGSFVSSYVQTTNGAVTRSAETANGSGDAATFNDSEGVLMAEISALANDLNIEGISISDGSSSNRVVIFKWSNSSNIVKVRITSGGFNYVNENITVSDITDVMKIAVKYKQNDFSIFINGFELFTETNGSTPINLNTLGFNSDGLGGAPFYGNTKQIQYYDSALNDNELETLTSWVSFQDMAEGQLYSIK